MKALLIYSIFLTMAPSAFAGETYVPENTAKPLFQALAAVFPEAREGFNHSESVFVKNLECISNKDVYRCSGMTIDAKELVIEGRDLVTEQKEVNENLNALWKAMRQANLPVEIGKGYSSVKFGHVACDHVMPGSDSEFYECGYSQ